jgi:hypothetical protein
MQVTKQVEVQLKQPAAEQEVTAPASAAPTFTGKRLAGPI